jgi:tetratricopeptide (TPR) repeat protein
MTTSRRLQAIGLLLAIVVGISLTHAWGEVRNDDRGKFLKSHANPAPKAPDLTPELAATRFKDTPVLTYRPTSGDTYFAVQIQPKLEAPAARPRDYLVVVDTSASQAGAALVAAKQLCRKLCETCGKDDRINLWKINIAGPASTCSLTNGFVTASNDHPSDPKDTLSAQAKSALLALEQEAGFGGVDLKNGLEQAIRSVPVKAGRQPILLYVGNGMSNVRPLSEGERLSLAQQMVAKEMAFFPVPLGTRVDPTTLHGLASATGGAPIRIRLSDEPADLVARIQIALATPIFYPQELKLSADVLDAFPTQLPPLRGDAPTLIIGRTKPTENLSYTVTGTVAGKPVTIQKSERVPAAQIDHFFLASMHKQWKNAAHPEAPALIRADRALVFAMDQNRIARDDLLAQGQWALARDHLDAAAQLFQAAANLDPSDTEARAGQKLVEGLRTGKIQRKQLEDNLDKGQGMKIKRGKDGVKFTRGDMLALAQAAEKPPVAQPPAGDKPPVAQPPAGPAVPPPADGGDLLQQQRQRMQLEGQRVTAIVDEALRQARRLLPTDPDAAHDLVRRTLDGLRGNEGLLPATRQALLTQLEVALRNIDLQGVQIKLQRDEQLRLRIDAQRRLDVVAQRLRDDELMKRRVLAFAELMNTGRFEEAWREALVIQQDAIRSGRGVPVAVTAAERIGDIATNLREVQEIQRQSEQRYLLTLLQVDKSHVPSPDEPPLTFPPASYWREISKLRKDKYDVYSLDGAMPQETVELRKKLNDPIPKPIAFDNNTPLKEALGFISDVFDITILIDEAAFKAADPAADVTTLPVRLQKMDRVSLGTVLKLLLSQIPDATYLIRKDYLEITTGQRALAEKVVRGYPAADLVIPIPNSVNVTSLNQNISIQQSQLSIGGGGLLGQGGGLGGGFGGFRGGFGGGLGGIGGVGLGGVGLAGIAAGLAGLGGGAGGQGGFLGGVGFQGQPNNLGFGGGFAGIGGGQLGQFGNLGGQFGMQGGDQSSFLLQTIMQVVAPGEWKPLLGFNMPGGQAPPAGAADPEQPILDPPLLNSLSYFPPARALVVRATSRIHTRIGGILARPGNIPPAALGPRDRPDMFAITPRDPNRQPAVAKNPEAQQPKGPPPDPRKVWQDALVQGVTDPGLIIATADFLVQAGKFNHAAEFLKANLRQGIVTRPWVFEALAIALQAGGGTPEEVERAQVSALDLEPQDAQGYLTAAQALAEQQRYDRALAFCQQAAAREPNLPDAYVDALSYAERAQDSDAMTWAASHLLRQDWPVDNADLHAKAQDKLTALGKRLEAARRKAEAERMQAAVSRVRERDLVVTLAYQGEASIDLKVKEPIGTVASERLRQTPGGGTLMGGDLSQLNQQTYVAAQAFKGDYEITVEKVWGRPLGSKVTVEIVQHQGTPKENRQRQTIVLDRSHTIKLNLADGRRTTVAAVPAVPPEHRTDRDAEALQGNRLLNKLRATADPTFVEGSTGMDGGLASSGRQIASRRRASTGARLSGDVVYQSKMATLAANSMDMTAKVVVKDGQSFMEVTPVFQTVGNKSPEAAVINPMIPGGK